MLYATVVNLVSKALASYLIISQAQLVKYTELKALNILKFLIHMAKLLRVNVPLIFSPPVYDHGLFKACY